MVEPRSTEGQVVIERDLLVHLVESGERMLDGMTELVEALRVMTTEPARETPPAIAAAPAEARVWDTSDDALENYDAEQIVALRADHRADNHDVAGCRVCSVLVRRLGSL